MKFFPSLILLALIFAFSTAFSQDRTALKEYADSLYMADKYEMARKAYDAFIAHDSSNAEAFHRRGTSYLEAEMLALAERDLRKATELDSLYANSYYNLGLIHNRQDKFKEGLPYFLKFIELKPEDPDGYANAAVTYVYLDQPDSFDIYFQLAYKLDSANLSLLQVGASNYAYFEKYEQAAIYGEQGIALHPEDEELYSTLIDIYSEEDKYAKTLEIAEKARKQFPTDINWANEVALYRILNNTNPELLTSEEGKAEKFSHISSSKTTELNAWVNDSEGKYYYPSLLERFKNTPEKMGFDDYFMLYYGESEQDGYSPYGASLEARTYREWMDTNDYEEALEKVNKALEDYPTSIDLNYYAASCYAELGELENFELAIQHYYGFALGILYTGDGLSFETALIVTATHDEYTIMDLIDLDVAGQSLVNHDGHVFDILTSGSDDEVRKIHFNIDKPFATLGEMFGGKKKKKKRKRD